ncbi:MAG: hypothetical protein AB4041_03330 [Microcystaceae cyanobacterium]
MLIDINIIISELTAEDIKACLAVVDREDGVQNSEVAVFNSEP